MTGRLALFPKGSKLYIAGPVTGMPNQNRAMFNKVSKKLRAMGYSVINPLDLDAVKTKNKKIMAWEDYLRRDIPYLCKCTGIVFLRDWNKSRGANLEWKIAAGLNMPMLYWGDTYLND